MNTEVKYLYYDKKGKICDQYSAARVVIQTLDEKGKIISEDEVEIYDEKAENEKNKKNKK